MYNARYADTIVAAMGLKDFSPLDMRKILAGKAAAVSAGLGNNTDVVAGTAGATDIETMLQMVWLKFAGVRRDEDLYKSFIGKQIEAGAQPRLQPGARFGDVLVSTLYGDNPRAPRALRPEDFASIDLDRAIAIYRQRFSSAKDLTFIFVGSFDVAAIKPLLATYLASLPTPGHPGGLPRPRHPPRQGRGQAEVNSGSEDKSTVSLTFTGAGRGQRTRRAAPVGPDRGDEHPHHRRAAREAGPDLRRRHAQRYLKPDNYVQVVLNPEVTVRSPALAGTPPVRP
jgi:zinc protease